MINHINTLQNENHAIILVDVEKVSDKIQHSFMIKILKKVDMKAIYINVIKAIGYR